MASAFLHSPASFASPALIKHERQTESCRSSSSSSSSSSFSSSSYKVTFGDGGDHPPMIPSPFIPSAPTCVKVDMNVPSNETSSIEANQESKGFWSELNSDQLNTWTENHRQGQPQKQQTNGFATNFIYKTENESEIDSNSPPNFAYGPNNFGNNSCNESQASSTGATFGSSSSSFERREAYDRNLQPPLSSNLCGLSPLQVQTDVANQLVLLQPKTESNSCEPLIIDYSSHKQPNSGALQQQSLLCTLNERIYNEQHFQRQQQQQQQYQQSFAHISSNNTPQVYPPSSSPSNAQLLVLTEKPINQQLLEHFGPLSSGEGFQSDKYFLRSTTPTVFNSPSSYTTTTVHHGEQMSPLHVQTNVANQTLLLQQLHHHHHQQQQQQQPFSHLSTQSMCSAHNQNAVPSPLNSQLLDHFAGSMANGQGFTSDKYFLRSAAQPAYTNSTFGPLSSSSFDRRETCNHSILHQSPSNICMPSPFQVQTNACNQTGLLQPKTESNESLQQSLLCTLNERIYNEQHFQHQQQQQQQQLQQHLQQQIQQHHQQQQQQQQLQQQHHQQQFQHHQTFSHLYSSSSSSSSHTHAHPSSPLNSQLLEHLNTSPLSGGEKFQSDKYFLRSATPNVFNSPSSYTTTTVHHGEQMSPLNEEIESGLDGSVSSSSLGLPVKKLITLNEAANVKLEKVKIERANGMKIYYFRCSLCPYQTNTSQSMKDHLYCIHCKAKNNYKCNICHQTFGWKNNAQRHMRRKHKIEDQNTKREAIITLI